MAELEVVASAPRAASGVSAAIPVQPGYEDLALSVDVAAVSGAGPTLDLSVEWSTDGGTSWFSADPADAFAQITQDTQDKVKVFAIKGGQYRIRWAIGGTTPSFTFSIRESPQR